MQKALLFFIANFVILAIAYGKTTVGFTSIMGIELTTKNDGTPSNLITKTNNIPTDPVSQLGVGNIEPSPAPPSDLPSAPIGFHSKETPNPYRNPTNEPAKYIRIVALKEDLQAFFGFEATHLETKTDPTIQIPLTRARADLSELIDIQSVIERNPGLPSRMNTKQVNDIQSNLSYLRHTLHDLEASGVIKQTSSEGFADIKTTDKKIAERASIKDLQGFQIKLVVEIKRLSASGTSDPLIRARLSTLENIKNDIDEVISKLEKGQLTPMTVPIMKYDIEKSLPILGQANKPLPRALKTLSLPPAIASLFPGGMSPKDAEQATQINNIASGYMKQLLEGASWGINVGLKYDNPRVVNTNKPINIPCCPNTGHSGKHHASRNYSCKQHFDKYHHAGKHHSSGNHSCKYHFNKHHHAGKHSSNKHSSSKEGHNKKDSYTKNPIQSKHIVTYGIPGLTGTYSTPPSINKPHCQQKTNSGTTPGLPGVSNRTYPEPKSGGLDWEKRSKEIIKQLKARGLNPLQFGTIPDNIEVSHEFSWRGYTRMICSRLNSTTDPGLAISCGCPPENWNGWKE